jgi:hypothetical protein
MKKAAEVSQGGFAGTRCFSSCLAAPPGLVLEDAGNRHVRPRAFAAIAVAIAILTAKQASARDRYRGPRRFLRWLAQARHDKVTLSGALVAVKKFFATSRNCASRLRDSALIAQRAVQARGAAQFGRSAQRERRPDDRSRFLRPRAPHADAPRPSRRSRLRRQVVAGEAVARAHRRSRADSLPAFAGQRRL